MGIRTRAAVLVLLCFVGSACEDAQVQLDAVGPGQTASPSKGPRPPHAARDMCPAGIEGKGLRKGETYPPSFESFNLWRTDTNTGRTGCLTIVAGQSIKHRSDGENDPVVYRPNGSLFIFGDYQHDRDGIGVREVPLPRPVRVLRFSGEGYEAVLLLQSLQDCSTVSYRVRSARFTPDTETGPVQCGPIVRRSQSTSVVRDCFKATIEPRRMTLACGDNGFRARRLIWTYWDAEIARGTGVFVFNDCDPACIVGTLRRREGHIALKDPRFCRPLGRWVFMQGHVRFDHPFRGNRGDRIAPWCPAT